METAENKPKAQSNTNVSFPEVNVSHVSLPKKITYKGNRNTVSVRVDKGLYLDFKSVAKRVYGSVCKPIEAFMATVIALDQLPEAYKSNTIVLNQTIQRNLTRERRNLHYESCSVGTCRDEAKFRVQFRGREFLVCANHRYDYWKLKGAVVVPFEQKLGEVGAQ